MQGERGERREGERGRGEAREERGWQEMKE
jgi:hypothetical protein